MRMNLNRTTVRPSPARPVGRALRAAAVGLLLATASAEPGWAAAEALPPVLADEVAIAERLLAWSCLSVGAGTLLMLHPAPPVRDFGLQQFVWGAIDGGLALWGLDTLPGRARKPLDEGAERAALQRLLALNAGLDVGYLALGAALAREPALLGHGLGVIVQGGFLLAFDSWHAWHLGPRRAETP